jgi:hypothetical protein
MDGSFVGTWMFNFCAILQLQDVLKLTFGSTMYEVLIGLFTTLSGCQKVVHPLPYLLISCTFCTVLNL